MNDLLLQLLHVRIIDLFADHDIESGLLSLLLVHRLHIMIIRHGVHLADDLFILGRCHLCAVLPVYLVSVIFRRVMAGCYHDT